MQAVNGTIAIKRSLCLAKHHAPDCIIVENKSGVVEYFYTFSIVYFRVLQEAKDSHNFEITMTIVCVLRRNDNNEPC